MSIGNVLTQCSSFNFFADLMIETNATQKINSYNRERDEYRSDIC